MCSSRASTRPPKYSSGNTVSRHQSRAPASPPRSRDPRLRRRSLSSAELCSVWKLREVRIRSSFGRGEERDVDRTDSSGEGGTVASEKRTVVGVADVYPSPPTEGLLCKPCFGGCFARARPPYHQGDFGECVAEVKTQTKSYTKTTAD